MKKFLSSIFAVVAAMSCFTACDEDEKLAMRIAGDWEGEFYSVYYYYVGRETQPRIAYASKSYLTFDTDHLFGSTRGNGYEVDFFNEGPIEQAFYEFDWRISDGVIYLTYFDSPDMNVTIKDYRLTTNHFQGYFGKGDYTIDLINMNNCDWSLYRDKVIYRESFTTSYRREDSYYSKGAYTRATGTVENTNTSDDQVQVISFGRAKKPVVEE